MHIINYEEKAREIYYINKFIKFIQFNSIQFQVRI